MHHAGAEVFDEHISGLGQPPHDGDGFRPLEIETTLFLPVFSWPNEVLAPLRSGRRDRIMSPSGASILITSAPRSASNRVQCGPGDRRREVDDPKAVEKRWSLPVPRSQRRSQADSLPWTSALDEGSAFLAQPGAIRRQAAQRDPDGSLTTKSTGSVRQNLAQEEQVRSLFGLVKNCCGGARSTISPRSINTIRSATVLGKAHLVRDADHRHALFG